MKSITMFMSVASYASIMLLALVMTACGGSSAEHPKAPHQELMPRVGEPSLSKKAPDDVDEPCRSGYDDYTHSCY